MHSNVDSQSSSASRTASPPITTLQRGKACLSCRRRKMKCDGARPVCTPCLRGERVEDCEYTDGQRRPRTLALEEDVARLKARLRELENPEEATPSVELHAPYPIAGPSTMRPAFVGQAQASSSGDPLQVDPEADVHTRHALSVIAPYATELGLFLDIDRLRVQGAHIVPALQSALTLWSVHITSASEPGNAQALERTQILASNLLSQTQTQLALALGTIDNEPDPAVFLHLIQTGILLAYYMQRIGQVVGARYYSSGTWTLAMIPKLHQNPYLPESPNERRSQSLQTGEPWDRLTQDSANACSLLFADYAKWTRALDGIEAGERVRAFWTVYALDRWFSSVGRWPSQSLVIDGNAMTVPWPDVDSTGEARNVIQHLLNNPNYDFTQDAPSVIHAQASVLLGEAAAVAGSYLADNTVSQSPAFQARFGTIDILLQRCFSAAMTMATARQAQGQAQALLAVHLNALALVTLHRPLISAAYRQFRRRCADAAFGVVQVLDQIGEAGVRLGSISPIYATVWTALCLTLHDEFLHLRAQPDADSLRRREEAKIVGAIRKLVGTLSALSQHFPSRFFAVKIETVLPILESISA